MKTLKDKIIKILEDYRDEIGGISMDYIADQILELFEAEKQKLVEDLLKRIPKEKETSWSHGDFYVGVEYNQALKELKTIIENAK